MCVKASVCNSIGGLPTYPMQLASMDIVIVIVTQLPALEQPPVERKMYQTSRCWCMIFHPHCFTPVIIQHLSFIIHHPWSMIHDSSFIIHHHLLLCYLLVSPLLLSFRPYCRLVDVYGDCVRERLGFPRIFPQASMWQRWVLWLLMDQIHTSKGLGTCI